MSVFVNAAGPQTWYNQSLQLCSLTMARTTAALSYSKSAEKNAIILADSTWSFFHSEWRVMESCQTVFSGVLPGVESLCPRRKQA